MQNMVFGVTYAFCVDGLIAGYVGGVAVLSETDFECFILL